MRYLFGVSSSKVLDSSFFTEYTNTTTSLGLTDQLYTAAGSQSVGAYYKSMDNQITDPETQLLLMKMSRYIVSESSERNTTLCLRRREAFTWN